MSTKLYHGYRINKSLSLKDIQKFFNALRRQAGKIYQKLLANQARDIIFGMFMSHLLHKKGVRHEVNCIANSYLHNKNSRRWLDYGTDILSLATELLDVIAKDIQQTQRRNHAYDFEFDVTVVPGPRMTLFYLYTEKEAFTELFRKMPGIEYFGYWNNTDRPDDVTAKQWKRREQIWDETLDDWNFLKSGLSWSLQGANVHPGNDLMYSFNSPYTTKQGRYGNNRRRDLKKALLTEVNKLLTKKHLITIAKKQCMQKQIYAVFANIIRIRKIKRILSYWRFIVGKKPISKESVYAGYYSVDQKVRKDPKSLTIIEKNYPVILSKLRKMTINDMDMYIPKPKKKWWK